MQPRQIPREADSLKLTSTDNRQLIELSGTNQLGRKGEVVQLPSILIVRWGEVGIDSIASLFENRGYLVTRLQATSLEVPVSSLDNTRYEAIVHTARSAETLEEILGEMDGKDYLVDHALIAKDEIDDVHCVVQLKPHASTDLKAYVKTLWAMCNIT